VARPRCLSLLARRRLRRAPAPDGTRLDPDAARHNDASRLRPRLECDPRPASSTGARL